MTRRQFGTSRALRLIFIGTCASACGGVSPAAPRGPLAKGEASLKVIIEGVNGSQGRIRCALFDAPEGFPGPSPFENGNLTARAAEGATCDFAAIPAGIYAVTVFHDANDNRKIDTNIFGAPTEGYGATNNHLPAMSAPKFADSSVAVESGQAVTKRIKLKY